MKAGPYPPARIERGDRRGVSAALAAVAVVALVAGGAGALYLTGALGGASNTKACTTTSTFSAAGIQTTFTIPCMESVSTQTGGAGGGGGQSQVPTSTASSTTRTSSTLTTSSSSNTNVLETFHAHFEWSRTTTTPSASGDWTETFTATGTFTLTMDFSTKSGSGTGQGTIEDKYTGFCTGDSTTPYQFQVYAGLDTLSGNLSIGFGVPDPAMGTTHVTCGSSSSDNGFGFGMIPVPLNIQAEYGASVAGVEGGDTYQVTLA